MSAKNKPWLKYWPPAVPESLDYPKIPLHELLRKNAKKHPENTAVAFFKREMTYSELDLLSDQFAVWLVDLGIQKGDRVAVFLPNIPQFLIVYFGILKVGAVLTAISPLHKEREVAFQLNDSKAKTIVTLDTLFPIVKRVWRETSLKNAVITNMEEYSSENPGITKASKVPNVYSFQKLMKKQAIPVNVEINPLQDLAALQYTGGTTGTSKGAMLTHLNSV